MNKILLALADREDAIRINNYLEDNSYSPYIVTDSASLISKLQAGFDMLIIDSDIADELELNIIKFIGERFPEMRVLVLSSREKLDRVIKSASVENFDYIVKPVNLNELKFILERSAAASVVDAVQDGEPDYFEGRFVGKSDKIKKVMAVVKKVAKNESNILITGETGTGKELIARAVYELSRRASKPFIAVNSAAIPENLLESELFGYKRGAFTGASADKKGLIELADSGTLFLDEIGDLSLGLQAKLLRVLENGDLRRLGDEASKNVNIRVIAATNQDLMKSIQEKTFREDLFFRLNVIHIHIPPLRERLEDIPYLLRFFIEKYNKLERRNIVGIDPRARAAIMNYEYPGNVRELDNIVQHAFAMASSDIITIADLPVTLQGISPFRKLSAPVKEELRSDGSDPELNLADAEKSFINRALEKYDNNHTKAAKALGISRSTLWRKMKEYGIGRPGEL
ncbi:MAG: sigma-54-dependent Fis family transcriptional regulator [Candidatus Goldbacteria bacterium]|nr:sigma-54-dependent Fis family transcriptional regulator [Candidatus Goldiibacteriota bacterium]